MKLSMFQSDYMPLQESVQPYSFSNFGPLASTNEPPAVALQSYLQNSKMFMDALKASSATPKSILKASQSESGQKVSEGAESKTQMVKASQSTQN